MGNHKGLPLQTDGQPQGIAPTNRWATTRDCPYKQMGNHKGLPLQTDGQPQGIAPTNSDVGAIPCGCPLYWSSRL